MNAAVAEHEQQSLRSRAPKPVAPAPPQIVVQPEPAASTPAVVWHEEPEGIREALDVSKNEERRRVEQQARDEDAFVARLEEWGRSGLETTQENANAIVDWIKQHPELKGYVSAQAVDLAVAWLGPKGSNVLTWTPKTASAPPPPAEPTEVLGTLPNGDKQLPLDKAPTNKASSVQVKDWLARTREATGKYLRPRGSFGSKF
jgi:hypothetical protein